jgi:hypothetical protein
MAFHYLGCNRESIYERVQSFSELATALYSFSTTPTYGVAPVPVRGAKLSPSLSGFFKTARADDEMRNFLIDAVEYLNSYAEGNIEVPVSIIRAMNDVERIAHIEEISLPPEKQDVIRGCVLQIARLAGDNGKQIHFFHGISVLAGISQGLLTYAK